MIRLSAKTIPEAPKRLVASCAFAALLAAACSSPATPTTATRRSQEEIQKTVRASFDSLQRCYDEALRRTPTLSARVTTRFTIGMQGKVLDVDTDTPPNADAFGECLELSFRAMTFSANHAQQRVTYPIDFTPAP